MEQVPGVIEVAKGISEFGMMEIAAAAFIVMGLILMAFVFRWFMRITGRTFDALQKALDAIVQGIANQDKKLDQLKEVLTGEVYNQIRIVVKHVFRSIIHEVCITIADTKEDNNLNNRAAVEERIRDRVENFYKSDCADLAAYSYNGKNVAECMNPEWMGRVSDYCIASVFDEQPYHRKHYLPHLKVMFEKFRLELFEHLKRV